jgi:hypothetical protein
MSGNPTGDDLRRWARKCSTEASFSGSKEERARLLKMRDALMSLAANQDWLNGQDQPTLEDDSNVIPFAERIAARDKQAG